MLHPQRDLPDASVGTAEAVPLSWKEGMRHEQRCDLKPSAVDRNRSLSTDTKTHGYPERRYANASRRAGLSAAEAAQPPGFERRGSNVRRGWPIQSDRSGIASVQIGFVPGFVSSAPKRVDDRVVATLDAPAWSNFTGPNDVGRYRDRVEWHAPARWSRTWISGCETAPRGPYVVNESCRAGHQARRTSTHKS